MLFVFIFILFETLLILENNLKIIKNLLIKYLFFLIIKVYI